MSDNEYIKGTKNELLENLVNSKINSPKRDNIRTAIQVQCTKDIENSINTLKDSIINSSVSNTALGKKVFWLNVVITIATITGIFITFLEYRN